MPTAADVCIALWLKQAYDFLGLQEMPSNCLRWTTALLSHDLLKNLVGSVVNGTVTTGASSSSAADSGLNEVIQKLEELKIEHTSYSHTLCMTAEELVANVPIENPNETHTKNLFLRDKKHGLFLVTVLPDTQVNTKELGTMLGLKGKTNLRLADAELLEQHLGCKPGCLGPLAIFKDGSNDVTLALDKGLLEKSKIHSHPLRNDASVVVTPAALQDYIAKTNHEPVILDFGSSDNSVSTAPPKSAMPSSSEVKAKEKTPKETQEEDMLKKTAKKGETLLALQWTKEGNFPMWYSDVITLSEMIAYYDISGCYILRPWSYKIWELIQEWFNEEVSQISICAFAM
jgi:prolyl-tRNA synthetase